MIESPSIKSLWQAQMVMAIDRYKRHLSLLKHLLYSRSYHALEDEATAAGHKQTFQRERLLVSKALKEQHEMQLKEEIVFMNKRLDGLFSSCE